MSDTIETSVEQVSEELREFDALESCLETFWCITDEGSDNRLLAEGAIQSAKRLRELLSARTVGEPFAWYCAFPTHGHLTMRQDEAETATADGATVTKLYPSPPPPQPGVRVTEELRRKLLATIELARDNAEETGDARLAMYASAIGKGFNELSAALTASIPDSGEGLAAAANIGAALREGNDMLDNEPVEYVRGYEAATLDYEAAIRALPLPE